MNLMSYNIDGQPAQVSAIVGYTIALKTNRYFLSAHERKRAGTRCGISPLWNLGICGFLAIFGFLLFLTKENMLH